MSAALLALLLLAEASPPELVVKVRGAAHARGKVRCFAFSRPEGFPQGAAATASASSAVANGEAECVFARLPAGTWAVSVFHDEDDDGALATNLFGIPREPWGSSRDAKGTFGPPAFRDAQFHYPGGRFALDIHLQH